MSRWRSKKLWIGVGAGLLGLLLIAVVAAFVIVPPMVDRSMNSVEPGPLPKPSAAAAKLHESLFIADLHCDALLWNRDLLTHNSRGHVDVPRLIEGNVALQALTVVTKTPKKMNNDLNSGDTDNITTLAFMQRWPRATWSSLFERALYQSRRLHEAVARSEGRFVLIDSARGLRDFVEARKKSPHLTAAFLGIEGLHCLEGKLENLDLLYNAGFRMMGPAHFFDNEVAGSAHGVDKGGLTPLGRKVIHRMEELKILVDLAHSSPATIDDVLAMATRPVIVSHTGVKGTCDNMRNLSDDHVRRIAAQGGLIGIGYWDSAVCATDVKAIVRAIRYAANLGGVDHVALGSDYDGTINAPFDTSGIGSITEELLNEGFSPEDIGKIMGGNALRLLLASLPETSN